MTENSNLIWQHMEWKKFEAGRKGVRKLYLLTDMALAMYLYLYHDPVL